MYCFKLLMKSAAVTAFALVVSGCGKQLSGEGPAYFTTAFQCEQKHSDDGWCFATPSRVYSSDYKFVGKGSVQDYIIQNGKICVANGDGCIAVHVEVKDRT